MPAGHERTLRVCDVQALGDDRQAAAGARETAEHDERQGGSRSRDEEVRGRVRPLTQGQLAAWREAGAEEP